MAKQKVTNLISFTHITAASPSGEWTRYPWIFGLDEDGRVWLLDFDYEKKGWRLLDQPESNETNN